MQLRTRAKALAKWFTVTKWYKNNHRNRYESNQDHELDNGSLPGQIAQGKDDAVHVLDEKSGELFALIYL
jgi:hypothetical protein